MRPVNEIRDLIELCDKIIHPQLVLVLNEILDHFTALERPGETKMDDGIFTMRDKKNDPPKPIEYHETPKPPATVERFNAYQFTEQSTGETFYDTWKRKPIGKVVAQFNRDSHWSLTFPTWITSLTLTPIGYEQLVDMMLRSGIWERTND